MLYNRSSFQTVYCPCLINAFNLTNLTFKPNYSRLFTNSKYDVHETINIYIHIYVCQPHFKCEKHHSNTKLNVMSYHNMSVWLTQGPCDLNFTLPVKVAHPCFDLKVSSDSCSTPTVNNTLRSAANGNNCCFHTMEVNEYLGGRGEVGIRPT